MYSLSLICQPDIRGHEAPHHHLPELCIFVLIVDDVVVDGVELNVLGCRVDIIRDKLTDACAWFSVALRPQKP